MVLKTCTIFPSIIYILRQYALTIEVNEEISVQINPPAF